MHKSVGEDAFSGSKGDSPQLPAEYNEEAFFEYAPSEEVPSERTDVKTSVATGVKVAETVTQMDWAMIVTYLYLMGVAFFMIRLLVGITRAETLCRLGGRQLPDGSRLLVCDGEFQPTSWRRTVIMSRRDFESADKDIIIEHELTHIHCHHSIDVVIAQLVCALQWFNPAAWALKRSLQEVHEYEADANVLADGENERRYQICLVQAALGNRIGYVTSNFADCSTKKRIKMMNRSQSSPFACLRALLMLPVVLVTILLASACKPKASQDNTVSGLSESDTEIIQPVSQLEPIDTTFLKKFGLGANQNLKIKQLNVFVEIEWDGAIWMTFDGEQTFHPATIDNFASEFDRNRKESTVEVARPDLVFVSVANDEHLDVAQHVIKKLQKFYSDDKIILINLPGKTVPPPPAASEYKTEYNVNFETDKWVRIIIDRKNDITMIAHNVTRILNSAEDIVPTLEGLKVAVERDSIDVEIKANNTIILRIPEITKTFGTPVELKRELKRLYPDTGADVYWMVTFDVRCSTRVENDVNDIFKEEPFTDKNKVRIVSSTRIYPPMPTRRDSIRQILLGKYGSGMDRSRHVKDMKWYNANKDKEEFFRMGFKDGQIYVGKGNDPSNMKPIEFDQLVPYFKENCPGGDERKAIVLFEINQDGTVSVAYMDKVLEKMENWVTTLTRRLWVSDKHIE
ncbi:MAG: DUF1647 domain-containing protein [Bacteroidaceae bacterium]|nr:DUF1647 domain-containing protein [Bacteroidaceae bacterium]